MANEEGRAKLYRGIDSLLVDLERDPRDIKTHLKVGDLYTRLGDTADATTHYQAAAHLYEADDAFIKAMAVHKQVLRADEHNLLSSASLMRLYTALRLFEPLRSLAQSLAAHLSQLPDAEREQTLAGLLTEFGSDDLRRWFSDRLGEWT